MTLVWHCDNCDEQRDVKRPHYISGLPTHFPETPEEWFENDHGEFCSEACWDEVARDMAVDRKLAEMKDDGWLRR